MFSSSLLYSTSSTSFIFAINHFIKERRMLDILQDPIVSEKSLVYKFDDPTTAYFILDSLDTNEPSADLNSTDIYSYTGNFKRQHFGLTFDNQYCQKHRAIFVNDPQAIFETPKIFSDYEESSLLRTKVFGEVGMEIQQNIGPHMNAFLKKGHVFDIRTDATNFFCRALFLSRQVGKQFSCLTQTSNHIPGNTLLVRKDYASETINEYKKIYQTKPQCLNSEKFFPSSYLLTKKDQCLEFFAQLNSPKYQELKEENTIVYIKKVGVDAHAASGVHLVDEQEENSLRVLYNNGELCGNITNNFLVQHLIHNPLLFNGRKFDFRAYMFIASTNPAITFYHDGVIWLSTEQYDKNSKDKTGFMPNASFNKTMLQKIQSEGTYNGKNLTELHEDTTQFYEDLQVYLLEKDIISDPNWLDNYLRPQFKKAMVHLIRMGKAPFLKSSSVYELLGLDFMLDTDLNVWFIEANIFPSFEEYTKKEGLFLQKLAKDHFEIINGLLKSRTKRIVNYVNDLMRNDKGWRVGNKAFFEDITQAKAEFKKISSNCFEPEFEPSSSNGFQKIVDENFDGLKRYSGLLEEECF